TRTAVRHGWGDEALPACTSTPPAPLCDRLAGGNSPAARLHPQRSQGTLEHEGVGVDHAVVRATALRLSNQLPDNFRCGTRLRQYRASGQRVLTRLGAGVQLPANLLRDLD